MKNEAYLNDLKKITEAMELKKSSQIATPVINPVEARNDSIYSEIIEKFIKDGKNDLILTVTNQTLEEIDAESEEKINQLEILENEREEAINELNEELLKDRNIRPFDIQTIKKDKDGKYDFSQDAEGKTPTLKNYLRMRKTYLELANLPAEKIFGANTIAMLPKEQLQALLKKYKEEIEPTGLAQLKKYESSFSRNIQNEDVKNLNPAVNPLKELWEKQNRILTEPISEHTISLNRIVNKPYPNLYVITDTANYNNAHKLIQEQIKKIDPIAEFIVIKNVYGNQIHSKQDANIYANLNTYLVPRAIETLKESEQNLKDNLVAQVKPLLEKIFFDLQAQNSNEILEARKFFEKEIKEINSNNVMEKVEQFFEQKNEETKLKEEYKLTDKVKLYLKEAKIDADKCKELINKCEINGENLKANLKNAQFKPDLMRSIKEGAKVKDDNVIEYDEGQDIIITSYGEENFIDEEISSEELHLTNKITNNQINDTQINQEQKSSLGTRIMNWVKSALQGIKNFFVRSQPAVNLENIKPEKDDDLPSLLSDSIMNTPPQSRKNSIDFSNSQENLDLKKFEEFKNIFSTTNKNKEMNKPRSNSVSFGEKEKGGMANEINKEQSNKFRKKEEIKKENPTKIIQK